MTFWKQTLAAERRAWQHLYQLLRADYYMFKNPASPLTSRWQLETPHAGSVFTQCKGADSTDGGHPPWPHRAQLRICQRITDTGLVHLHIAMNVVSTLMFVELNCIFSHLSHLLEPQVNKFSPLELIGC